jgi:hypothetical protein
MQVATEPTGTNTLTETEADQLRTRVRTSTVENNRTAWAQAEALYLISLNEHHPRRWGFKSWIDWAERELGLLERKAYDLRAIHKHYFVDQDFPSTARARLLRLPWTTARVLLRVMTPANHLHWLLQAETSSRRELEHEVREAAYRARGASGAREEGSAMGAAADGTPPRSEEGAPLPANQSSSRGTSEAAEVWTTMKFSLADCEGEPCTMRKIVEDALQRAKELAQSEHTGHLLQLICFDFLATNDFDKRRDPRGRQLAFLAKLESLWGLRVIVADDGEVIYGLSALEDLARQGDA